MAGLLCNLLACLLSCMLQQNGAELENSESPQLDKHSFRKPKNSMLLMVITLLHVGTKYSELPWVINHRSSSNSS